MANINISVDQLLPQAGSDNAGRRISFSNSVTKVAQNDTVTLTGAATVVFALFTTDADGVADPVTISGNVITLTSATAGPVSGVIVFTT